MSVCLVVQHVQPEGPSVLGETLIAAGVELQICRVFEGDPVPKDCAGLSGIVVMGGPMSAADDTSFPTRQAEISLLQQAIQAELPVLGICLGAQLLAVAAGGRVFAGEAGPEIGWGDIELATGAANDVLLAGLPERLRVLHWHGDTFDLPPGAVRLASSAAYPNQAFRVGRQAWGLQFHLEVDVPTVLGFIAAFGTEARNAGVDPAEIAEAANGVLDTLSPSRQRVLSRFTSLVAYTEDM